MIPEDGYLLRIFVGESDKHEGKPLYEWLVLRAREAGLAGATVLRGIEGFGAHSRLHTAKILRLSEDLPIVVDQRERIVTRLKELGYVYVTLDLQGFRSGSMNEARKAKAQEITLVF